MFDLLIKHEDKDEVELFALALSKRDLCKMLTGFFISSWGYTFVVDFCSTLVHAEDEDLFGACFKFKDKLVKIENSASSKYILKAI